MKLLSRRSWQPQWQVMINFNSRKPGQYLTGLRLLPYAALGAIIFSLNSATNLNYIFRGYLVLLEAQFGIVVIYFLMSKLARMNKRLEKRELMLLLPKKEKIDEK